MESSYVTQVVTSKVEARSDEHRKIYFVHTIPVNVGGDRIVSFELREDRWFTDNFGNEIEPEIHAPIEVYIIDRDEYVIRENCQMRLCYGNKFKANIFGSEICLREMVRSNKHFEENPDKHKARRYYRRRASYPQPDRRADSDVNRRTKTLSMRVSEEFFRSASESAVRASRDRTGWIASRLERFLDSGEELPAPHDEASRLSVGLNIRFDPELAQRIEAASASYGVTKAELVRRVVRQSFVTGGEIVQADPRLVR